MLKTTLLHVACAGSNNIVAQLEKYAGLVPTYCTADYLDLPNDKFDLSPFKQNIATPVTHAPGNVHTNFVFFLRLLRFE